MKVLRIVLAMVVSVFSHNIYAAGFDVKVVNKMSHNVEIQSVFYIPKAGIPTQCAFIDTQTRSVTPGKFINPSCAASVNKWQRKIQVTFKCPQNTHARSLNFPRSGKFFKRDHAINNGQRYTVKLKNNDC